MVWTTIAGRRGGWALNGALALMLIVLDAVTPPAAAAEPDPPPPFLVTAAWLLDHLDRVQVVDARSRGPLPKRRIPGAVAAPWQDFTRMDGRPGDPGWGTLLPPDQLAAKLGALGIDGSRPIVVYAETPGWGEDGRFAWMAQILGLHSVSLLDGGISAWVAAGGRLSWTAAAIQPRRFTAEFWNSELGADTAWIRERLGRIQIVDSRTPEEYRGARKYGEARGGHLPGAISLPFDTLFAADGTLKPAPQLERLFVDAGLRPEDEIVVYCTAGIRSAYLTLILRRSGFLRTRNYDASFYEWAGRNDLPLE